MIILGLYLFLSIMLIPTKLKFVLRIKASLAWVVLPPSRSTNGQGYYIGSNRKDIRIRFKQYMNINYLERNPSLAEIENNRNFNQNTLLLRIKHKQSYKGYLISYEPFDN
jgi:hypothetical protein